MATKTKTAFVCQQCGTHHSQWLGKCSGCGEWNTIVEEISAVPAKGKGNSAVPTPSSIQPIPILDIQEKSELRTKLCDGEFNRLLGGGLVAGSVTLIGGEPGIGKSTLLLQLAIHTPSLKVLYVSGEESPQQIKMRASRLEVNNPECEILSALDIDQIIQLAVQKSPQLLVVDSVQTMKSDTVESSAGSVAQIKTCTAHLIHYAKQTGTPVILIGHITKEGNIAGPKLLEHMVDTVLQFEGDTQHHYRLLRAHKNRYGSTDELGIYEMKHNGIQAVANPSSMLLDQPSQHLSGNAIGLSMAGVRPLLIEVQALVSTSIYGTPQRTCTGFDPRRLHMLIAVIEKRSKLKLGNKDVFLNITGGIRIEEPAVDLAVFAAIVSSHLDMPITRDVCLAGEIGLSGEVRPVQRFDQRLNEAEKQGFKTMVTAKQNKDSVSGSKGIKVMGVKGVDELIKTLFSPASS